MSIGVVGTYPTVAAPAARPVSGGATPVQPGYPYTPDAYTGAPAAPTQAPAAYPAYPQQPGATVSGANIGRFASWGAGAFAAARWILPHVATGWMKIALVLGGALAGNFLWNKLEQDVPAGKAGGVGHVGTMAAGAGGAFMLGRALLGTNPAGWLIGGIIAGGAWLGHKLYAGMQKA